MSTPIYAAVAASHAVDPANLADLSLPAVEARSTAADRERGAKIAARLGEGER